MSPIKNFYNGYLLLLFAAAALLIPNQQSFASPQIHLPETEVHLGDAVQGDTASGHFIIENHGTSPLEILDIKPSCGCTVAELEKPTIQPGEKISVKVDVDTEGKSGPFRKVITIKSDSPKRKEIKLYVYVNATTPEHGELKQSSSLFEGKCAACHTTPAKGLTGEPLFEAVCQMCHGHYGLGGIAKRMNQFDYLLEHDNNYFENIIRNGLPGSAMPAFSKEQGGPLDEKQIKSLVKLMRWWEEGFIFKANVEDRK